MACYRKASLSVDKALRTLAAGPNSSSGINLGKNLKAKAIKYKNVGRK